MSDEHVRDELLDFAIGYDASDRTSVIERHLRDCVECKAELGRLRHMVSLLEAAPLDPAPPPSLEDEVFSMVERADTVALLKQAPLGPEPDSGLANRVLSDPRLTNVVDIAGARKKGASRGLRALALVGAAALVVALGFSVQHIGRLNDRLDDLRESPGAENPPGHPMQTVAVAGVGVDAQLELVHFRHDNYRLELLTDDFPVQKEDHHYEVWLKGEAGETLAGSFRISRPDRVMFILNVGIDPAAYTQVEIIEEPDSGGPDIEGEVVARGNIDPTHVDH